MGAGSEKILGQRLLGGPPAHVVRIKKFSVRGLRLLAKQTRRSQRDTAPLHAVQSAGLAGNGSLVGLDHGLLG